jgi:hypothetical protein
MGTRTIPSNAIAVNPSDTNNLNKVSTLYVGVGGDLTVTLAGMTTGTSVTYVNIPDGFDFARAVIRVWNTGTTCTNIIADYD